MKKAMTSRPQSDSGAAEAPFESNLESVIEPRDRDLGNGFLVRRLLPAARRRAVGPFVFFDHFGPVHFAPGQGLDVPPHPHINLATVTYLFDGEILHRDSLGSQQTIRPGDINWMTAGRGIVHSERTDRFKSAVGSSSHGLQLWVALPPEHEETQPAFHHHPEATLPVLNQPGVVMRVLVGEAFGLMSPVHTFSRLIYLDVQMQPAATFSLPDDEEDRGLYIISGAVVLEGQTFGQHRMLSLRPGRHVEVRAEIETRFVLLGGARLGEPRHLWWNFVSSSLARIEQAKLDWRDLRGQPGGPFPLIPGDETDFVPLPEG